MAKTTQPSPGKTRRRGLTLVEMMVSMVITLMMIFALAQAFQTVSATISFNRSTVEMASQLRSTAFLLQRDLEGLTVPALPLADPASNSGYLEYVERPDKDYHSTDTDTTLGDVDDVLMFTSRNPTSPFSGLFGGSVIEAPDAEIIWWTSERDYNGDGVIDAHERFVYRRVLLIRPDLDGKGPLLKNTNPSLPRLWPRTFSTDTTGLNQLAGVLRTFYNENDISVRLRWSVSGSNVTVNLTANSLSDLSNRENRFAHHPIIVEHSPIRLVNPSDFPTYPSYPFALDVFDPFSITFLDRLRYFGTRQGEDVVLQNTLSFDVQAYDTLAQVRAHPGDDGAWGVGGTDDDAEGGTDNFSEAGWANSDDETTTPGDRGYAGSRPVAAGAFVDLNYNSIYGYTNPNTSNGPLNSSFSGSAHVRSGLAGAIMPTWDSWSLAYETDGVDQDGDGVVDEGANGFDDDGVNGVDDPGERETSPPYNVPLRGMRIRLRIMETENRLVRQSSVVVNFIPE